MKRSISLLFSLCAAACVDGVDGPYVGAPSAVDAGPACPAGEVSCDETGFSVKICSDDNENFTLVPCGEDEYCGAGRCEAQICPPNEMICQGRSTQLCNELGGAFVGGRGTNCEAAGMWCRGGECVRELCEPDCNDTQYCSDEGECRQRICEPDQRTCDGAAARLCDSIGGAFVETTDCTEGTRLCHDGVCVDAGCGNGILEAGEICDDANLVNTDACTNACRLAACGDGVIRTDIEEGQPGYEVCDDNNVLGTDGCTSLCTVAACGDGFLRGGVEECDDANRNDGDACTNRCAPARCGDGSLQVGEEQCDDGNRVDNDDCSNDCQLPNCGDGIQQDGEQCDDGDELDNNGCTNGCAPAVCGDGIQRVDLDVGQAGFEACDDENEIETDACINCALSRCGDGFIQVGVEACEDNNRVETDDCVACNLATCGDSFIHEGVEGCDDANQIQTDACLNDCTAASCGDGIRRVDLNERQAGYEACDDGNEDNEDRCSNICTFNVPGGSTRQDAGTACASIHSDLPNLPSGNYWIDPDGGDTGNAFQVACDMTTLRGGWIRAARLQYGALMWDAWRADNNAAGAIGVETFGLRFSQFSDAPDGTDLAIMIKVDGAQQGPVYSVHREAWNSHNNSNAPFAPGFDYQWPARGVGGDPGEWQRCADGPRHHDTGYYNWSITSQSHGCGGFRNGTGFLVHGRLNATEYAGQLYGLGRYFQNDRYSLIDVYLQRR
jgi:cysteine-rich repeat protein